MSSVAYPNLALGPDGLLYIAESGIKLVMLAGWHRYQGWSADEIQAQFPQLTLGQIHSALAYYYDHKAELDAEIESREQRADQLLAELADSAGQRRLHDLKSERDQEP